MSKTIPWFGVAGFLAALCLVGCNTFERRSSEKAKVFDSLSTTTQNRLKEGKINLGDTPDMVYIALGNPDEKRNVKNADGSKSVWLYKTYWEQYEGTVWSGWHRRIVPARGGRGYVVVYEPIAQDVYRTQEQEDIRVDFSGGVVVSVEQQSR